MDAPDRDIAQAKDFIAPPAYQRHRPETTLLYQLVAEHYEFVTLIIGCVLGGCIYVLLDNIISKQGGFLRKTSTLLTHYRRINKAKQEELLAKVAAIPLFQHFPSEEVETLLAVLEPVTFKKGDEVIVAGKPAEATYLVLDGIVEADIEPEQTLRVGPGELVVSLIPMFTNLPHVATGIAQTDMRCLRISRAGFAQLRELSPEFDAM